MDVQLSTLEREANPFDLHNLQRWLAEAAARLDGGAVEDNEGESDSVDQPEARNLAVGERATRPVTTLVSVDSVSTIGRRQCESMPAKPDPTTSGTTPEGTKVIQVESGGGVFVGNVSGSDTTATAVSTATAPPRLRTDGNRTGRLSQRGNFRGGVEQKMPTSHQNQNNKVTMREDYWAIRSDQLALKSRVASGAAGAVWRAALDGVTIVAAKQL